MGVAVGVGSQRKAFEDERRAFDGVTFGRPPLAIEDDRFLLAPLRPTPGTPGTAPDATRPVFGFTVIEFDIPYIETQLLPELARQHFSLNNQLDYRVAVTAAKDPQRVIYRSDAQAPTDTARADAVEPLSGLLMDEEFEVRQMAAFALGLIGHSAARPALTAALNDAEPIVQGRAAEALGAIGDRTDAGAVSAMVQAHVKAGALMGIAADDLGYPLAAPAEAVRLGLYALVRLGSYDALAAAALTLSAQSKAPAPAVPFTVVEASITDMQAALKAGRVTSVRLVELDRKSTRLNSSHMSESRMPSSA